MIILALLAFALLVAAFACLCAAMQKHQRDLFVTAPGQMRTRLYRYTGWALLAASLLCAMAGWRISTGIVAWVGMMTVAALIVVMLLTYRPKILRPFVISVFALPLLALAFAA